MRFIFIRNGNGLITPILELSRQKIDNYKLVMCHKLFGVDTDVMPICSKKEFKFLT